MGFRNLGGEDEENEEDHLVRSAPNVDEVEGGGVGDTGGSDGVLRGGK